MGRFVRFIIVLAGLLAVVGFVDHLVTHRGLQGRWQYSPQELSEQATNLIVDQAEQKVGAAPGQALLGRNVRRAISRVGNRLLGVVAQDVSIALTDGGYRFEGSGLGSLAASSLYQGVLGSRTDLTGCSSGSYFAAFPLMKITCGDGSGRSLWLLLKGWPGQQLTLLPLPIGNDQMQQRLKQLAAEEKPSREKLEAVDELLTLRFVRGQE